MARDRQDPDDKHADYGESMKRKTSPDPDEGLNSYYTRKQRTKENDVCADADAEYAPADKDRAASDSDVLHRDGFLNYKGRDGGGNR